LLSLCISYPTRDTPNIGQNHNGVIQLRLAQGRRENDLLDRRGHLINGKQIARPDDVR
jgi:hypothetical protein